MTETTLRLKAPAVNGISGEERARALRDLANKMKALPIEERRRARLEGNWSKWFDAMTEEENGHFLHAARVALRVPSVIRLLEYRRIPHQTRALSRKNILLRDRNTCQYCGDALSASDLTLDHVIPRSRGGASTWENLVACCHSCNRRKGNQLPVEAGMKLMREPHAFNLHTSRHIMRLMGRSDDKWRKYLFY